MTLRYARGLRLLHNGAGASLDPRTVAAAAERVLADLRAELSDLIGAGGVAALVGRALSLARRESAILEAVRAHPDGSLDGLAEALGSASTREAETAGASLIDHLLGLLVSLMGEDVGLRPVRRLWPEVDLDVDYHGGTE